MITSQVWARVDVWILKMIALKAHSLTLAQTCFEMLKITRPQL